MHPATARRATRRLAGSETASPSCLPVCVFLDRLPSQYLRTHPSRLGCSKCRYSKAGCSKCRVDAGALVEAAASPAAAKASGRQRQQQPQQRAGKGSGGGADEEEEVPSQDLGGRPQQQGRQAAAASPAAAAAARRKSGVGAAATGAQLSLFEPLAVNTLDSRQAPASSTVRNTHPTCIVSPPDHDYTVL